MLVRVISKLILLMTIIGWLQGAYASSSCEGVFQVYSKSKISFTQTQETVFGRTVAISNISARNLTLGKLPLSRLPLPERSIFVGITPQGHGYLIAGKYRYDGQLEFSKPELNESNLLSEGVVLRIADVDGTLTKGFEEYFEKTKLKRKITCISGLCSVMKQAVGLGLSTNGKSVISPHIFLKYFIENNAILTQSKQVETQFLVLGDHTLEGMFYQMQERTEFHIVVMGFAGIGAVLSTILMFAI